MDTIEKNLIINNHKIHVYIDGPLNKNSKVILAVNGGPGSSGLSLVHFKELTKYGYTLIRYDQYGCNKSEFKKGSYNLYKIETYVDELIALINKLKLNKFILLGHSWGGMIILEYLTKNNDPRIDKLILFSTLSSSKIWSISNYNIAKRVLKDKVERDLLINAYKKCDFTNKKVISLINKKIWGLYYKHRESTSIYKKIKFKVNKEIYNYMWGSNELVSTGNLKDWDVTSKLKNIKIPTLVVHGRFDQSTKEVNKAMLDNIKNSKELYLSKSGHCGYFNEFNKTMKNILKFIM